MGNISKSVMRYMHIRHALYVLLCHLILFPMGDSPVKLSDITKLDIHLGGAE